MNTKFILFTLFLCISKTHYSQSTSYQDSVKSVIDLYIQKHEVVKGSDRQNLHFFPIDERYRVVAIFERKDNSRWFKMDASGPVKQLYRVYGTAQFTFHDTIVKLNIYQTQSLLQTDEYKENLFIPFTDLTSGEESYIIGRYLDFKIHDIQNDQLVIDFNKAYNPYCAYVHDLYSCPIPPKENHLKVSIRAGEMNYGKKH